jgi:triosephosphate isomerase (TIM)
MTARRPLIAGNWKMHGRQSDLGEIGALKEAIGTAGDRIEVLICPPAVYVPVANYQARQGPVVIGAQDCSATEADAARTGEISAAMLKDAGARYIIVGHSERRSLHGESDGLVRRKAEAAQAAGAAPIVCVGETQADRAAGKQEEVVDGQLRDSLPVNAAGLVVAYEPVWAIGGDRTPTLDEIAAMHRVIRTHLDERYEGEAAGVRILYGGSVGPKNAGEIFAVEGVDGALVGRASLKAADFSAIILAHPAAS